jgi:hypothetical protein
MAGEDKGGFFGMSDDDFEKITPNSLGSGEEALAPSLDEEGNVNAEELNVADPSGDDPATDGGDIDEPAKAEEIETGEAAKEDENLSDEEMASAKPPAGKEPENVDEDAGKNPDGTDKSPKDPKAGKDEEVAAKEPDALGAMPSSKNMKAEDLASFYDEVTKPFKANGREITLRSPEEARRLMQMGAGYGRKLQDMQPHLKTLRMLEKNNLLDEAKLSYLIDLDLKSPEAIKKLIKDSGINPLDLDIDENARYSPTDHSVTDDEVVFAEALKEVTSQPGGRDTIQHINTTWDKQSKEFLWGNPQVLAAIQDQRTNGVYAEITAEVERKKMLGEIDVNVPFLEAYKIAGDALVAAKSLNQHGSKAVAETPQPASVTKTDQQVGRVLGTRTAAPKSSATNSEQAKAAASTKSSSSKAKEIVNPLDMADDDFLKQFENRL